MEVVDNSSGVAAPARSVAAAQPAVDAWVRESRFRIVAGVALGLMLTLAAFGLAWDIRWHSLVGRDTFFTPPHLLLYAGAKVN
jgi:hypothetical protein